MKVKVDFPDRADGTEFFVNGLGKLVNREEVDIDDDIVKEFEKAEGGKLSTLLPLAKKGGDS